MRIRIFIALLPLLPVTAVAQSQPAPPQGVYHIHKLSLESTDLSRPLRQNIVQAFQGGTYNLDALAERVRSKLRESGYEFAEVNGPQISRPRHAKYTCDADVSFAIHAGDQYRLARVTFTVRGKPVFTATQLRSQLQMEDGAIFNATEIGKSLENLKDLYGSAGYPNFGAIPKPIFDNSSHTISLSVDIDQGFPATFGKLFLDGIEPRAGAA